ncbi:fatty acid desaturase [Phenylobacterium sp. RIFCSPHIGHO2_01_FULL_69_31]|uniref:fatty acid desaturase family protein n=1 Tax=Phenylobacterium sp. RIFCSPHIGHO2_01_FULL_69_31 TaxID=1801944 RepID=UPI0025CE7243|nr:fatty acid desaturase [Phenylobacterium sp. RIFCSPHIGHO2_01_FULL_69_31]
MNAHADISGPSLARQANDIARDLTRANPRVYWLDLAVTAAVTWLSLLIAVTSVSTGWAVAAGAVCILSLYRGISFIHELTHLRRDDVPGFHIAWNILIGVPFLTPSLLYEGVHVLHHAKDRYGTARDPEYHPLARRPPHELAVFLGIALLAPVGTVLRFAVLAPISFLVPPFRRFVVAKTSGMVINPGFSREDFERARSAPWLAQEIASWLWSWTVIGLAVAGVIPWRALAIAAAIFALMTFLNQLRTAVAHYWENDGEPMAPLDQFLDSVNVPPPALLPFLWAPVGLRYHALHHLMPRLPYHNLGVAHRRLVEAFPADHVYRRVEQRELFPALRRLIARMRGSR